MLTSSSRSVNRTANRDSPAARLHTRTAREIRRSPPRKKDGLALVALPPPPSSESMSASLGRTPRTGMLGDGGAA
ncbi:hypothetical protein C6P46_000659 [Rhodotorula mucilaginosa]|uniref:Uncharacterized protein n=1 Tax=Rhodotorula mucilaginosa TaxID=5537 RepID=A0A9P7B963_RHOMI|nr:hypothetical protein C6P46_000659 [Rhodotorula mucilaginosa]